MNKKTYHYLQTFLLAVTLLVVGASFYFQYVQGLEPCPLCLMQRTCGFLLGMFSLMGLYVGTMQKGKRIALMQIIFSLAGLFFAGRQLWLQSLPQEQVPACMPGLDVLIRYFPWKDVLHALVWGAGDCAERNWEWLGLSMPAWAGLYFLFFLILSSYLFLSTRRNRD